MNIKNLFTLAIAGTALVASVGTAVAAPTMTGDIDIYGASAQYNFWTRESYNYMSAAGCTGMKSAKTKDGKHFIMQGTCPNGVHNFRVSSKASYDGPLSIQGNTTNPNRVTKCDPNYNQRMMMDPGKVVSWGTGTNSTVLDNTSTGTGNEDSFNSCFAVTGGASDVQVTSFKQISQGQLKGPFGGGNVNRNFTGTGAVTATGLADCRSVVVPFSFYINNGVTKGGQQITDITTAQARLIFSGQIFDWSDLGTGFDALPMYACWRHAGSGTAATLDLAVMRPALLQTSEDTSTPYYFWFNDGSSDEMNCISNNAGGVGYADADQSLSSYPSVHQLTYNGVAANKANITAGKYDFYTVQNLYTTSSVPTDMANLCTYMQVPAHNSNPYYANTCEMRYIKAGDTLYNSYNVDYDNGCPVQ